MNSIPSPITGGQTSQADTFDSKVIVGRYRRMGLDVSSYYADLAKVELRRCSDTGYRFFYPPTLAGEARFYDDMLTPHESEQEVDYRTWSDEFQFALDHIRPGERVLDVGCGYGKFLLRASEKANVSGIDGQPRCYEKCQALGLDVRLGMTSDHADELRGEFDVICAFHVLEHVYDVRGFIEPLLTMLKPNGRLIIAVPHNEPYFNRFDKYDTLNTPPHHVGLWNRDSLEAMARHFGLRMEEHRYTDVTHRVLLDAYYRARYWMGVTSPIHQHSAGELARILLAAPFAVAVSFVSKILRKGVTGRSGIAVVLRPAA